MAYQLDCSCVGELELGSALISSLLELFEDPAADPIRFGEDKTFTCEFDSNVGSATLISLKHTKDEWLYHISARVNTKKDKESLVKLLKSLTSK